MVEAAWACGGATSPTSEACDEEVDVAEALRTTGDGCCGAIPVEGIMASGAGWRPTKAMPSGL